MWRTALAAGVATVIAAGAMAGDQPDAEPMRFQSQWLGDGVAISGATPLEIGPAETGGAAWIGRYPYGEGALYGCFDAARRMFHGVWTQTSLSIACAEPRHGAEIWGEAEFEFDADFQRFDGWWNACGETERFGWSGRRDPSLRSMAGAVRRDAPACPDAPSS